MNEKYIPLYRKYRPQRLEEIVGQEHIKKALANAISMNRISHAYLFTGPRGTGKTSTARIFAKSLNCEKGPTITPCGECTNCVDITNSVPMDVIEIDAASNRKVEDAQNILEKVMYAPVNSRYKIYIIDEVHMLSTTAFNALLKTLEEPPENVIFILATTEAHKVLDTIKSRCQRFDFRRITTDDIVKHLRYISDKEGINIEDDALFTIAKNSAGGMRDSIALLDQLSILDGKEAISTDDINNLLGRISFDVLNSLAAEIVNSNAEKSLEILEKIYNSGNDPSQILSNLLDYMKNLLIVKNCSQDIIFELTQLNEAQITELKKQSDKLETQQITMIIDKISSYIKEIKLSNNPRLWLEVGIIDISNLTENTKLSDLQNRIIKLEQGKISSDLPPVRPNFSNVSSPIAAVNKSIEKPVPQVLYQKTEIKEEVKHVKEEKISENSNESKPVENKPVEEKPVQNSQVVSSAIQNSTPADSDSDISALWDKLLQIITSMSAPTMALFKPFANPVKITPEETIISIKNEQLLGKFSSGNKKEVLISAVDTLFSQSGSNVVVRLPEPSDEQVKASQTKPSQPKKVASSSTPRPIKPVTVDEIEEEELMAAKSSVDEPVTQTSTPAPTKAHHIAGHSDQVNMVMDLFDGKIID